MERNNNSKKDMISQLLQNLNSFTDSMTDLEGNLNSTEMESINLTDASSKSISNLYFELGSLRGKLIILQEKFEDADFKVAMEQEYSHKLEGEIGDLKGTVSTLEEEEQIKCAQIEDLNSKLQESAIF